MITRISCIAILSMFLPVDGSAQPVPSEGERVRIHQLDGTVVIGTVQATSPQTVWLLGPAKGTELVIAQHQIRQIERSVGRHRKFRRNFQITVAASAVGFGVVSAISWSPCVSTVSNNMCYFAPSSPGGAFQEGVLGGALVGMPIGLIVGLAVKHERWERLLPSEQRQPALSIRPILGRELGLSASYAFGGR